MAKARKFRKKLAVKKSRQQEAVLSINLIKKEYLKKISNWSKKISALIKGLKIKKYVTR